MILGIINVKAQDSLNITVPMYQNKSDHERLIATMATGAGMSLLSGIDVADRGNWICINPQAGENNIAIDVLQYAPIALPWVMKLAGSPTRSGWAQMAVSQAIGVGIMAGSVKLLKDGLDEMRPDGSGSGSFPSGHSAWAFLGATMISRELGWRSSWYTFGAYTFATGVAVERVLSKRHFPADVVAGAGIGVISGELGYLLGDVIFGKSRIENEWIGEYCNLNKVNISLQSQMLYFLNDIKFNNGYINQGVGLETSLSVGVPVYKNIGIDMKLGLRTTPIFITNEYASKMYVSPYNCIGVMISPYYRKPIADRYGVKMEIGGGYYRNMALQSVDDAINVGSGGFVGSVKVGADMAMSDNMVLGVNIGYDISEYKFSFSESSVFGIKENEQKTGLMSGLGIGVSMKMNF